MSYTQFNNEEPQPTAPNYGAPQYVSEEKPGVQQYTPQYPSQYPPQYPQPVTQTVIRTECTTIPPSYLGLSIFTCLFCCWPFGLVAIVKASEVSGYVAAGNFEAANRSSQMAKNWSIASLVCGIFILIGVGIYLGISLSAASNDPYGPY